MKIKICFERETHRLAKLPESFKDLQDLALAIFISELPSQWRFQYVDCEDDRIMIGDEAEYQEFLNSEVRNRASDSAVKIYIVPLNPAMISLSESIQKSIEISERCDEEQAIVKRPVPEAEPLIVVVSEEITGPDCGQELDPYMPKSPQREPFQQHGWYYHAMQMMLEQQEENERRLREEERILREREEEEVAEMIQRKLEGRKKGKGKSKAKVLRKPRMEEICVLREVKPEKTRKLKEVAVKEEVYPVSEVKAEEENKPSVPKEKPVVVQVEKPDIDELVMSAVEKQLEKIAMMTSSFLKAAQTQEIQTQTQQKQEEEKIPEKKEEKVQEKEEERPVHRTVRCDGCKVFPIQGARYKCSVCQNFDFCENCEEKVHHEHAFIKIKFPGQHYAHKTYGEFGAPHQRGYPHFPVWKKKKSCIKSKKASQSSYGDLKISKVAPIVIEPTIETNFSQLKRRVSIFEEKIPDIVEIKDEVVIDNDKKESVEEQQLFAPPPMDREYSGLVHNKAKHMKEILPQVEMSLLLEFIDNAPEDLDLAELLENFRY